MGRVDYDAVAQVYDRGPYRDKPFDPVLQTFLSERSLDLRVHVLDVACGTGTQLAANRRERPGLACVGVDISREMLRIARRRDPDILWVRAHAAALPFPGESFDYVSNQFALHHILSKREFLSEAARVLRQGGRLTLRNLDPWSMKGWILYRYFPATLERDLQDFMALEEIAEVLGSAGLSNITVARRHQPDPVRLGEFARDVRSRCDRSQLIALSEAGYEEGLARVEADLARMGPEALLPSEKCEVTVTADKQ